MLSSIKAPRFLSPVVDHGIFRNADGDEHAATIMEVMEPLRLPMSQTDIISMMSCLRQALSTLEVIDCLLY